MVSVPIWPTEAFLREIDVHKLLPQQEPFVMIDRLVLLNNVRTVCETIIHSDNIFVEDGTLTALGLMENIAQTCAARIGFINFYLFKKEVQIGYIGAIRNFEIIDLPKINEKITTTVDVKEEVFGMILAVAKVMKDANPLATTEIKIAVKQDNVYGIKSV